MKKTMTALLSIALIGAITIPSFAANVQNTRLEPDTLGNFVAKPTAERTEPYAIEVNGKLIPMKVVSMNGTDGSLCLMVPLRTLGEVLGFSVTWNNGAVLVDDHVMHTEVTIGVDQFFVSTSVEGMVGMSAPFSLGVAPFIEEGITYVPLMLFDTLLGCKEKTISVDGRKIIIQTEPAEQTQIANPFIDCETLDAAQKIAGFSIVVPNDIERYSKDSLSAIENQLIQVIYKDDDKEICVRKAVGNEDISGDYTVYEESSTDDVNGLTVTMKGCEGKVNLATWQRNGYTFSIGFSSGMSKGDVDALIQSIN